MTRLRSTFNKGRFTKDGVSDKRLSTCKRCLRGVFAGQPTQWITGAVIGLVHEQCQA